jgi:hypothetical protein
VQNYKKIILSVAVSAALSSTAHGASYEFDNFTIDWDTVFTAGVLMRIEDRDPGISEGTSGASGDLDDLPLIIDNAFIINSNDGNNNFDKGLTSARLSLLTEADINFGDFGLFVRGKIWQDRLYGRSTDLTREAWHSYNANPMFGDNGGDAAAFGEYNPAAERYSKQGAELLDVFAYGSFQLPYDREVSVRLGRQVISWGEALLSGGGLATAINPVDAHIRSQPGFELKELFLPTGALFIQTQLTDMVSMEAYYQYEWNPVIIDPSSTYMSEFDSIGAGGNTFLFVTGQEERILGKQLNLPDELIYNPDPNVQDQIVVNDRGYNDTVSDYRSLYEFLPSNCPSNNNQADPNGFLNNQQYYDLRLSRCRALISTKVYEKDAKDTGQFGVAFNVFLESGAEMGFYFVRYHEHIPTFTLPIDSIGTYAPIIDLLVNTVDSSNPVDFKGVNDISADLSVKQLNGLLRFLSILPDDFTIGSVTNDLVANPWKLGLPDVTDGNLAIQSALAAISYGAVDFLLAPQGFTTDSKGRGLNYRISYFEDVDVWGLTYSTIVGTANVATELTYRQNTPLLSGDVPRTAKESNLWNWHINTLMVFEPYELFGISLWDFASFTAEMLFWDAPGKLPYNPDDLENSARLAVQNTPNGVGASAFMGLEYYNVFSGWDINVPLYVNWGIDGSQFNAGYRDGQVTFATGMVFKHLSGMQIGTGISFFFGDEDDIFQRLTHDRDNAQIYFKYAF